jgi:hypothetical protein
MYRDDDAARDARANALIDEIADLERQKLARASVEQRLETARRELAGLAAVMAPPVPVAVAAAPPPMPGLAVHLCVFGAAAAATFVGYTLLF